MMKVKEDDRFKIVLDGHFIPETPITTSPPFLEKNNKKGNTISQICTMPVYTNDGQNVKTPYMPASGIRGPIRRIARDVYLQNFEGKLSYELYRIFTNGGVVSKQEERQPGINIEKYTKGLRKNPFLGLFGACAPTWVEGELSISPAIPDFECLDAEQWSVNSLITKITGSRANSLKRNPQDGKFLSSEAIEHYAKIVELFDKKASKEKEKSSYKKNSKEAKEIDKQIEEIEKKLKELSLGGATNEQQIVGYEAIPPRLPLENKIVLRNVSPVQAGLFFLALNEFALDPYLGARRAQGCGLVRGKWDMQIFNLDNDTFTKTQGFELIPFLEISCPEKRIMDFINQTKDICMDYIRNLDGDELEKITNIKNYCYKRG